MTDLHMGLHDHDYERFCLMILKNYYQILRLTRDASDSEIKNAYRKLALECHPDHHQEDPEAEDKFKQISEAYSVLGDVQKRRDYDLFHYPNSMISDVYEHINKNMGSRYMHTMRGNGCCGKSGLFIKNTPLNVKPGQIYEFLLTPEEAQLGAERLVLITSGRKREGYRVRIPGGVHQGAQIKTVLGRDENRYIFIRITISESARRGCMF
jgi:curved DNA-binding protein CbpA